MLIIVATLAPSKLLLTSLARSSLFWRADTVLLSRSSLNSSAILQQIGFPLEARVGTEAVRRFKQSANRMRGKLELKSWK